MSTERDIARQWVNKARNDLLNADNNLVAEHVPSDTVCFHCQQATEKMLKAALSSRSVPPPRTHDLLVLLDQVAQIIPSVKTLFDELVILTPYAVETRYPGDEPDVPSIDDAREARECAAKVFHWIKNEFPELIAE